MNNSFFPCACCGHLTISNQPPGTFEICPICNWEDDNVQFDDPNFEGGSNDMSLNQAKENYRKFKARSKRDLSNVRSPQPNEIPISKKSNGC